MKIEPMDNYWLASGAYLGRSFLAEGTTRYDAFCQALDLMTEIAQRHANVQRKTAPQLRREGWTCSEIFSAVDVRVLHPIELPRLRGWEFAPALGRTWKDVEHWRAGQAMLRVRGNLVHFVCARNGGEREH